MLLPDDHHQQQLQMNPRMTHSMHQNSFGANSNGENGNQMLMDQRIENSVHQTSFYANLNGDNESRLQMNSRVEQPTSFYANLNGENGHRQVSASTSGTASMMATPVGKPKRQYPSRSTRTRNSNSSMLPLLQHSGVDGFTNSINDSMADGGPTVRQHLQQQQAVQRQRQQHEAMVRRLCQQQKDGSVTGWSGGAGAQEKLQQQTLAARKRPQIESAPPSVTTNPGGPSPCSLSLGSGPSSSASYSGGEPFAHHQLPPYMMMVSAAPPPPPQFAAVKADSLSPIKRSSTARGSRAAKNAAKMNGLTAISPSLESVTTAAPPSVTVAPPAGSSVDALANTIASVASGGGSFEFDKVLSASPNAATAGPPAVSHPPAEPSANFGPSTSLQPSPTVAIPRAHNQHGQAIVNALAPSTPQLLTLPPSGLGHNYPGNVGIAMAPSGHQQPHVLMDSLQEPVMAAPSQCRIHVQNPPYSHGDFPPTGTKIQVVHMQPSAGGVQQSTQSMAMASRASPQPQGPPSRSTGTPLSASLPVPPGSHSSATSFNSPQPAHYPPTGEKCCSSSFSLPGAPAPPFSPYHHHPQLHHQLPPQPQQSQMMVGNSPSMPPPPYNSSAVAPSSQVATFGAGDGAYLQQHPQSQFPVQQHQPQAFHHLQQQRHHPLQSQTPASGTGSATLTPPQLPSSVQHYHHQQQQLVQHPPSRSAHNVHPPPQAAGSFQHSPIPSTINAKLAPPAAFAFRNAPPPPSFTPCAAASPHPPQRVQLSRAQLLTRHNRDMEARRYAVKLYHLQRTIKALVYKNGALADELARLNQRICTVTEERKMLAKRLQHHERNRIRRIQSQYRKAIAAEAAAAAAAAVVGSAATSSPSSSLS